MVFARLHKRGLINGILASATLSGLVYVGSRRLLYFDAALVPYLYATLFAVMGIVYRYTVWLDRPSTRRLWKRSIAVFSSPGWPQVFASMIRTLVQHVVFQRFIQNRSLYRWVMHFTIAWGTVLAFAVTLPLVFGWLHFETAPGEPGIYQLYAFGFPQIQFHPEGLIGFFFFNALNISALMVIFGTIMAFTRRITQSDQVAAQNFMNDLLPLLILFAVAATGLLLTFSARFLGGQHYRVLSTLHCFTVVIFLVYLPFGKFFHIFQRGSQIGAAVYIQQRKTGDKTACAKCGDTFTSRMQSEDVKATLSEIGFSYQADGTPSIQDLCPVCRRRLLMWSQHGALGGRFDSGRPNKETRHG